MKKSVVLSLVCASLIYGRGFVNPLPNSSKTIENGGILSAIDAYQDGVGAMVVEQGRGIDNSAMNSLVFKYGYEAKDNGMILGDQVLLTGTPEDKLLAGKLYPDGGSCSDGNDLTQGETWLSGVCQGGLIPNGLSCNDDNVMTINDMYVNQICIGKIVTSPICADVTMVWNGSTNLCEKGSISTYGATQEIAGYTISASSNTNYFGMGLFKNQNTFRWCWDTGCGAWVYMLPNGKLSANTIGGYSAGLVNVSGGFAYQQQGVIKSTITMSGTSVSASSLNGTQGLQKVSDTTFRAWNTGSAYGAAISWVPFYSGYYCLSGGTLSGSICTLNTYQSETGICQIGYTLIENKCIQN